MQYNLQLNLRQRAALKTATSFWEKKEIKDKAAVFLESCDKFEVDEAGKKWREFTKTVIDEWNKDLLPHNLESELIHIVKMIGKTIFNWYQYIKHENVSQYGIEEKVSNYFDVIHWTPYGTVDGAEILKSSWMNNPSLNLAKVYNMACSYALEEHIHDLWNKIPRDVQNNSYEDIYKHIDQHILAYWECHRDDQLFYLMGYLDEFVNDSDMDEFILLYDINLLPEVNMLRLSVYQSYYLAVKYFWAKLTEEQKNKSVLGCARIALMRYKYYQLKNQRIGGYKNSQYVEICIFLINQMSETLKEIFFNEPFAFTVLSTSYMEIEDVKDEILMMLLSTWPWQELFIPVLKDMLQYLDDDSQMVCKFLDKITYKMIEDHKLGYSLEMNKYRYLLREAWLIIPGSVKQNILCSHSEVDFIENLGKLLDFDSLKLIFNDPEIASVRDDFIDMAFDSYRQLILNDQFDKLDEFIEEIYSSEKEKEYFKKTINIWYELIKKQFHLADKYLEWTCSTPEEKKSTKNGINAITVCESFIEKDKLDLADEFLEWRFETKEERRNCKDHFKSNEFSTKMIYNIWRRYETNVEEIKEKSSQFLHWFLESEEEIAHFKNKKMINSKIDKTTMWYLVNLNSIGNINDFLSWCTLNDEEIQRIKQAVSKSKLKPVKLSYNP